MSETSVITNVAAGVDNARIVALLATELGVRANQIAAAVELLDDGATVPFIARYRKEATGGLDDTVLRNLEVRLGYLRELEERRGAILESISQQGKLTPELQQEIAAADTKQRLEDLYAPYKPKRRTRAQIAREAGLEPLADAILADPGCDPAALAAQYLNPEASITDAKAALDGARDILAERYAENADLLADMREHLWSTGLLYSKVVDGKETEGANFRDWFDFNEPRTPALAPHPGAAARPPARRAELRLGLEAELEAQTPHPCVARIADFLAGPRLVRAGRHAARPLAGRGMPLDLARQAADGLESELIGRLRESGEAEAIRVFAANLKDLLLAAPAGPKAVLGLDPGIRTGCKVAVIDQTGKVVDTTTVYPFEPRRDREGTINTLAALVARHKVDLIAIGNGTASRESRSWWAT